MQSRKTRYALFGLALLTLISSRAACSAQHYVEGWRNGAPVAGLNVVAPTLFSFGVVIVAVLIDGLRALVRASDIGEKPIVESALLVVAPAIVALVIFATIHSRGGYFLDGFARFAAANICTQKVRDWVFAAQVVGDSVPPQQWPKFIADLRPEGITVETVDGVRKATFMYGGAQLWGAAMFERPHPCDDDPDELSRRIDDRSYVWIDK
jgi:hypothetical protein